MSSMPPPGEPGVAELELVAACACDELGPVVGMSRPFEYEPKRYSARTREPSGASHQNAVLVMSDGTPRHTTACSSPASRRICGICATCPNMSGR